jgi:hypothetical protein
MNLQAKHRRKEQCRTKMEPARTEQGPLVDEVRVDAVQNAEIPDRKAAKARDAARDAVRVPAKAVVRATAKTHKSLKINLVI